MTIEAHAAPGQIGLGDKDIDPHHSLAASLARTEPRLFFAELVSTVPTAEQVGPVRRLASNMIWGVESVPVLLHRAKQSGTR